MEKSCTICEHYRPQSKYCKQHAQFLRGGILVACHDYVQNKSETIRQQSKHITALEHKNAELERQLAERFLLIKSLCNKNGCEFRANYDGEGAIDRCNEQNCPLLTAVNHERRGL